MHNETIRKLSSLNAVPKRLLGAVGGYVASLALAAKKHTFKAAAEMAGLDESRISAAMNLAQMPEISRSVLNRSVRRRLRRFKRLEDRLVFIVDGTIVGRRGKGVENAGKHHSGSGFVWGHRFVNFVLLGTDSVLPLASEPIYSERYARENGLKRRTEIEIVVDWIQGLGSTFSGEALHSALFLFDSGYDAKAIQHAVKGVGADFVMSLKSSRAVNGTSVRDFFWRTRRWLKNQTIRLNAGSGKKRARRTFSVRAAHEANLKGFGLVTAVCSVAESRRGKPKKYLATSDLEMSPRDVLRWYAMRWRIETWHREMKQGFGFVDCRARRFSALESHVRFTLTAYVLQREAGAAQITRGEHELRKAMKSIKAEANKFGSGEALRSRLLAAVQDIAA